MKLSPVNFPLLSTSPVTAPPPFLRKITIRIMEGKSKFLKFINSQSIYNIFKFHIFVHTD